MEKNYRNYATYFKTSYKAIIIRQYSNSEKINAQIERTEQNPEIDTQKQSTNFFYKIPKNSMKKRQSFNKSVETIRHRD